MVTQFEPVALAKVGDVVLAVVDDLRAHVRVLPVRQTFAESEHAPSDPVAGLKHHDLVFPRLDLSGGHQPRQPRADDQQPQCPHTSLGSWSLCFKRPSRC